LCSFGLCIPQFFYLTVQLVSFSTLLSGFTLGAIPKLWGMVIFAILCLTMELLGGMHSVVLSDAVQACIMIAGFIIMPLVLVWRYGTLSDFGGADCASLGYVNQTSLRLLRTAGDMVSAPETCPNGLFVTSPMSGCEPFGCIAAARPDFYRFPTVPQRAGYFWFVVNMVAFPLNPHMVQRAYIAQSDWALRLTTFVVLLAPFLTVPPGLMTGMVRATYGMSWPLAQQDATAFASVGSEIMKFGFLPYVLVAVVTCSSLAAVMSTADSVIMGVANTLSVDIFKGILRPKATSNQVVQFGLVISCFMLVVGIAWGINISPSMFPLLLTLQNGILLQVVPTYLIGLFGSLSTRAGIAGILVGTLCFFVHLIVNAVAEEKILANVPEPDVGFIANVIAVLVVQVFFPGEDDDYKDSAALARFGERLTLSGIREYMADTWEPNMFLIATVVAGTILTTPFFPDLWPADEIIMGFPAWAFFALVLMLACMFPGLAAAYTWKPGEIASSEESEDDENGEDSEQSDQ